MPRHVSSGSTIAAIAFFCLMTPAAVQAEPPSVAVEASSEQTADTNTSGRSWPRVLDTERMGLGMTPATIAIPKPQPDAPRQKITWERRADCLDHNLQIVIEELAERFGSILVTSTCRTPEHNRRVGGVKTSQHIGGHAVDFYLYGDVRKAREYLRTHFSVGSLGYYGNGRFHVDNGPIRNW